MKPWMRHITALVMLARNLYNSLRELGSDGSIEDATRQIPDACERLGYIARMAEQAAARVLNAADIIRPAHEELEGRSRALGPRWEKMFANQLSVDEFKALAADTRDFFGAAPDTIGVANAQLTEIILAQDFQDLTGQVIKKVVDVVQNLEKQLVRALIEIIAGGKEGGLRPAV